MKFLRLYLVIVLCLIAHLTVNSQSVYRLVDTAIGLPDDEVKGFFYAPDGRLGIRTSSGFSLFDGCAFRVFSPMGAKPYKMNYVTTLPRIYVDAEQRVWSKEQGQLLVFDLKREAFEPHVDQVLANWGIQEPIRDFFVDEADEHWAVTVTGKLLHQGRKIALRTQGLRDVCRQGNRVWMVYNDGYLIGVDIHTYQVKSTIRLWTKPVLPRDFVRFTQKGQQLWVMWDHGVASYLPKQNRWQQRYGDDRHTFTTLAVSPEGRAFLGVRQLGLITIEPNGKQSLQTSFPMMDGERVADDIQSIAYERGNLVLGFYYKGMALYNANMQGFPFYAFSQFQADGLGFYRASCTSGGNVCLAFPQQVLTFNPYQITLQPLQGTGAGDDFIQSFTDSRGRVWVGTFRKGIYLKDGDKVSHFMQEDVPNKDIDYNIVRDFAEDHQHQIWVCYHGGVGRFDEQAKRIFPLQNKLFVGNTNINSIVFDRQHRLWAATNKGLIVGNQLKLKAVCKALAIDKQGWIWVGTMNGVYVFDIQNGKTYRYGKEEGMTNEMIQDLVVDKLDEVWVTTANGLCRIRRTRSSEQSFALTMFDSQNKLGDAKFLPKTAASMADGKLFFGSSTGFYIVDPIQVKDMEYTGHPVFTSLLVNNQEVVAGKEYDGRVILPFALSTTRKIVLEHDENFITVHFSGLNFDMPHHTYYKYRLQGVNNDWIEINPQDGIGRANYTDLSPGTYKLEVYSAGLDKVWSKQSATLEIEVLAPLWATWWAKLLYLLAFIALMIFGVRWKIEQNRKRMENEKYKELEEMKYRFFTNISHEFRTLLTLIITPIGSILKRTTDGETRHQLNDVSRNAGDLLQLVNQLLDFRKMEMNGEHLNLTSGNLNEFIQYTTMKFMPLAEQKNIRLAFEDKTEGLFMYFDKDKVGKILTNLLSNAFKFTKAGGSVCVSLEKCILDSRRCAHIIVEDTGCGIPKKDQAHVFERFYRTEQDSSSQQIGSGIGLNMVYEYIQLHEGKVSLESEEGKGSRFIVDIPADLKREVQQEASEENRIASPVMADVVDGAVGVQTFRKIEKTVLVVEDNEDFSHFLSQELGRIYNKVLTAKDGIEGAMMAEAENPDIIVSDVMMPRMSGTDMCRRIKENIETSHIPIILLTAWSTDEGRAAGYKAGADAYIAKPFDMEVLLARISNLLEKQEKRQRDFSHSISLDPKTVTDSSPDEDFLKEVIACIEKNIDNSEYTIDSLSTDVVMSRMSLYRKMKSLTGQTPADFIRTVRLKTAAKLLKEEKCTVSEACYRTGFASPQNFAKHFKEMFGVLPSQYS
ncbi:hybrid sensor histidine kinase/response regulator transcription factor [Segatella copri]|uniref:hybrid sensor histidine kinase/response regulator transcription factor n=1 Tax=Segatella copri TaxID=165179 RepID=UPI0022E2D9B3|nr:ATP-binding protein [Segatella copri]